MKKEPPIYNDADQRLRAEIKGLVKSRGKSKDGFRGFITEAEFMARRRLGLSCDGFRLVSEIARLARQ